jgi:hypothetical protein
MKFIPTPKFTTDDLTPTLDRLERDVHLKVFFAHIQNQEDDIPKLYVKSDWRPNTIRIPPVFDHRLNNFQSSLEKLFKRRRGKPNLLPFQERVLSELAADRNLLFPDTDKGLGPCAVTYEQYVQDGLKHLNDATTWAPITADEAAALAVSLEAQVESWLETHDLALSEMETKYIRNHIKANRKDPFGYFYLLYKIHKEPISTRPVCSDVNSLLFGLGKWIDTQLQPVAQAQPAYFQDSFALRSMLMKLEVPPNARLFTADAVGMYPNIPTEPALAEISQYLREQAGVKFHHYDPDALIEALEIVFRNNVVRFGDLYRKQISGTGMGKPPAPPWANIFMAIKEDKFSPVFQAMLMLYKRFIDDIIGLWLCDPDPVEDERLWSAFKANVNDWHGLQWIFSERSFSVDFMDMTISISNGRIETTLFEKKQNLYLYIPPSSAHPPGMISGLIFGSVLRIERLCSKKEDVNAKLVQLYHRLLRRGYTPSRLIPLFVKARANAKLYLARSERGHAIVRAERKHAARRRVYFHIKYHPQDPLSHEIQSLWHQHVANPPGKLPLPSLKNYQGGKVPIDQLVIAYSRNRNLRNLLSVRKLINRGREVSSFL